MELHLVAFFSSILFEASQAFPAPVDTVVVQVQQWGLVGTQQVVDQVLLNGVVLTDTKQVDIIIRTISADAHLLALTGANQTVTPANHIIVRERECILEGTHVQWTDRVFYDGTVFLSLDHTDNWTPHVPQAQGLKDLLEQAEQQTTIERIRLEEGCARLVRELRLSEEQSVPRPPLPQFLIPVFTFVVFMGLIFISLLLAKKRGLRHPGGVIGSVIHYPQEFGETAPEVKGSGYRTL
ncbi:uncharacterized protein LOC142885180 [Nelusetta ayraudi]|uniref:uncharacterized protein LOC142885180 n=1 Tax=Nelusetta ayraudi TaxID=303726 RepID=UPI003F6FF83B